MKIGISIFFFTICLSLNAQVFDFIVAKDGSGTDSTIQAAIDKCPDNKRSIVYVKNGTYFGQTYIGSKTAPSSKIISLIGEDPLKVVLTFNKSLPMVTTFEEATTFQIYAKDFYAENITFANSAGNTGQALALYTAGDRQTFKNCYLLGYQDTYRSKKGTRGYFKNCWIEGATDFIYAGGTIIFDDCTINCINGGGYIAAPEDSYATIPKASTVCQKFLRLGFIFRNCNITANPDVSAGTYALGRPWNTYCGAFYLNCKLGKHIKSAGWATMGGNETSACFAEYNSMDANGIPIDVTGRVSWSFQLPKQDADSLLTSAKVYANGYSTTYDPLPLIISPAAPTNVNILGNTLTWTKVNDAVGYIVFKEGKYLVSLSDNTYNDNSGITGKYSVKAINYLGVLSLASDATTATTEIRQDNTTICLKNGTVFLSKPVNIELYSASGRKILSDYKTSSFFVNELSNGVYILKLENELGDRQIHKIVINNKQ